jgi:hypothetical protein
MCTPKYIIILKEQNAELKTLAEKTIIAFKKASKLLDLTQEDEPKITYLVLTKNDKTKLFFNNNPSEDASGK